MRTLPSFFALSLLLSCGGASAQSELQSKQRLPSSSQGVGTRALGPGAKDMRAHMQAWYEDCRKGWDTKTHMSKKDYERTCRRMAQERVKFLSDDTKGRARAK
jgi:hypothetical protein